MAVVDQVRRWGPRRPRPPDRHPGGGPRSAAPGDRTNCTSRPAPTSPAAWPRPGRTPRRARSSWSAAPAVGSGTSTAPSTSTSTAASARCSPATATRRSCRRQRARHRGHALRPADTRHHPGRRRAGPPVRPAAVALHQLRHRVDDGRHPPDAGGHGTHPHHQGRGHLPRPPRRGAGVGVPGADDVRPPRPAGDGPRARRRAARGRRPRARRPVRTRSTPCAGSCSPTPVRSPG